MDCIKIITQVITLLAGLAAIITAIIAIPGLWKWKKQLKGTEEYQDGKELIKLTYKVRDYLDYVRHPILKYDKKQEESDFEAMKRYYLERFQKFGKILEQIHNAQSEAEFHWGKDIKNLNYPIMQKIVELQSVLEVYLSDEKIYNNIEKDSEAWQILVKGSNDNWGKDLEDKIKKLEEYINKKIK